MLSIQVVTLPTVLFRKGARHLHSRGNGCYCSNNCCPDDWRCLAPLRKWTVGKVTTWIESIEVYIYIYIYRLSVGHACRESARPVGSGNIWVVSLPTRVLATNKAGSRNKFVDGRVHELKPRFSNVSVLEQIGFRTKYSRILRLGIGTKIRNSTKPRDAERTRIRLSGNDQRFSTSLSCSTLVVRGRCGCVSRI